MQGEQRLTILRLPQAASNPSARPNNINSLRVPRTQAAVATATRWVRRSSNCSRATMPCALRPPQAVTRQSTASRWVKSSECPTQTTRKEVALSSHCLAVESPSWQPCQSLKSICWSGVLIERGVGPSHLPVLLRVQYIPLDSVNNRRSVKGPCL